MNYFVRNLILGSAVAVLAFGAVVVCSGLVNADTKIPIDEKHFPDKAFRECVKSYYDTDGDGYLSSAERNDDDNFALFNNGKKIKDLTGIEYLTSLTQLGIQGADLTEMDLSKNTNLEQLSCDDNKLTKLDLSKNTKLRELYCSNNPIESLDLSKNLQLERLYISKTKIKSLDLSKNYWLDNLWAENLGLTEQIDVSKNKRLSVLVISGNKLKSLDVSGMINLEFLICEKNELETLDVSGCEELKKLTCYNNKLKTLDISSCSKLHQLRCHGNQIDKLDISRCEHLLEAFAGNKYNEKGYVTYYYDTDPDFDDEFGVYELFVDDKTKVISFITIDDNTKKMFFDNGAVVPIGFAGADSKTKVTMTSSDDSIVKIGDNNTLVTLKAGSSDITAKVGDKEYKFKVTVYYKDVKDNTKFWFEPTYALTEKGVVKGYNKQTLFKPGNECTRAQMVTFIWRLAGSPEPKTKECKFPDVDEYYYCYKPVIWAVENGITTGYSDGEFKPYNNCTRAQAVTFLWRMAGKPEPGKKAKKFSDVKETDYCYKATLWASDKKILAGYSDGTFKPKGKCLRRQMVTFLYKYNKCVNVK